VIDATDSLVQWRGAARDAKCGFQNNLGDICLGANCSSLSSAFYFVSPLCYYLFKKEILSKLHPHHFLTIDLP
jgi:hypothetical protein